MATVTFFILFCWIRIAIFVKMSGFVGRVCVLNVMLVCAGHIFTLHGKCHQQLQVQPDVTLCLCDGTINLHKCYSKLCFIQIPFVPEQDKPLQS